MTPRPATRCWLILLLCWSCLVTGQLEKETGGRDESVVVGGAAGDFPTTQLPPPIVANCFSLVDELQWGLVVGHNSTLAAVVVQPEGAGPQVLTCLRRAQTQRYRVAISGDQDSQQFVHPGPHEWEGGADALLADKTVVFKYLIYGGRYRVEFSVCNDGFGGGCGVEPVYSDYISIQSEVEAWCEPGSFLGNASVIEIDAPVPRGMHGEFSFSYTPCSPLQPYDVANVTMFVADTEEECGTEVVAEGVVSIGSNVKGNAVVFYHSPEVEGDHFYCVSVRLSHISCQLGATANAINHCWLKSDPVWIPALPPIGRIIPFCTSHLACAWLYIVIGGGLLLIISLLCGVLCVKYCDRRQRLKRNAADEVDFSGEILNLAPVSSGTTRQSWAQLHAEWETGAAGGGEEKERGKILLLYSPDTKLFKELQEALKSFLDLACHCDIYDLFDDALFDTIALDPSEWLSEFVTDKDVKIIIISSIGAYRRQMALQGQMPLNLPENSLLDGLFTSGLRFISTYPGLLTSGRVATARYEMLHLTEEGHALLPPLANNCDEFLVPTQLHELFCWVYQLEPLHLMGKPWGNYHLELQLLQDALKLARRDRTQVGNCRGLENGVTML